MATYYLKATNEESLWTALEAAGLAEKAYDPEDENNQRPDNLSEDSEWSPSGSFVWVKKVDFLDVIGVIRKQTGNTITGDDYDYPETVEIDGYHANLRASLTAEQKNLLPIMSSPPRTPVRKWAGDS